VSLKGAAKQVLELLERGHYAAPSGAEVSIAEAQAEAVGGTCIYTPAELEVLVEQLKGPFSGALEVSAETTQVAAQALAGETTAVLNFASARNPGGGFLGGAKAQEEDLCRCSGLYPTLLTQPVYYDVNRKQRSLLYTDHAIYSPGVPFFRIRGTGELLETPFRVGVITMPAPNTGPYLEREPEGHAALEAAFLRRWRCVIAIACEREVKTLVLGAWGCGAFRGDPEMAARTAAQALGDLGASLSRVRFAIPTGGRSGENLEVFRRVLGAS
jgi:uncharacterized protein (TIGR02452 family)